MDNENKLVYGENPFNPEITLGKSIPMTNAPCLRTEASRLHIDEEQIIQEENRDHDFDQDQDQNQPVATGPRIVNWGSEARDITSEFITAVSGMYAQIKCFYS